MSSKVKNLNGGFTLMEVIIVVGLIGMIFGLTAFVSINSYRGSSFRNERDALIGVLGRARNQAMNNTCLGGCTDSKPHGVHITVNDYTIFQGATYNSADPLNEVIKKDSSISIQGLGTTSFTDVIFTQLSGDISTLPSGIWDLTLINVTTGQNSKITTASYGQITWTN